MDSENYLLTCQRYIKMNPVKAGIVKNPEDYWWSSYQCHALGKQSLMHQPHELYMQLGKTTSDRIRSYRQLFNKTLPDPIQDKIRKTENNGKPLGYAEFRRKFTEPEVGEPGETGVR